MEKAETKLQPTVIDTDSYPKFIRDLLRRTSGLENLTIPHDLFERTLKYLEKPMTVDECHYIAYSFWELRSQKNGEDKSCTMILDPKRKVLILKWDDLSKEPEDRPRETTSVEFEPGLSIESLEQIRVLNKDTGEKEPINSWLSKKTENQIELEKLNWGFERFLYYVVRQDRICIRRPSLFAIHSHYISNPCSPDLDNQTGLLPLFPGGIVVSGSRGELFQVHSHPLGFDLEDISTTDLESILDSNKESGVSGLVFGLADRKVATIVPKLPLPQEIFENTFQAAQERKSELFDIQVYRYKKEE
jgi:hypothetical protein